VLNLGDKPMQFYRAKYESLGNLNKVPIADHPTVNKDLLASPSALWIGKSNSECDSMFTFPSDLCKVEVKSVSSITKHIALSGVSKDSFQTEQTNATQGPTKVPGRKSRFLFVTNAIMTESQNKTDTVVSKNSMFINAQRWNNAFTSLFWFMKDHEVEKEREGGKNKEEEENNEDKEEAENNEEEDKKEEEDKEESVKRKRKISPTMVKENKKKAVNTLPKKQKIDSCCGASIKGGKAFCKRPVHGGYCYQHKK